MFRLLQSPDICLSLAVRSAAGQLRTPAESIVAHFLRRVKSCPHNFSGKQNMPRVSPRAYPPRLDSLTPTEQGALHLQQSHYKSFPVILSIPFFGDFFRLMSPTADIIAVFDKVGFLLPFFPAFRYDSLDFF